MRGFQIASAGFARPVVEAGERTAAVPARRGELPRRAPAESAPRAPGRGVHPARLLRAKEKEVLPDRPDERPHSAVNPVSSTGVVETISWPIL